ncbi:MAG: helix-turn-helix domain-containing protein [Clostridia bacterium]|nr:helix-turn-helix domain-containing protein [Clostridia bacterium]
MKQFCQIKKTGYTLVPNGIIREKTLSAKALGVYILIVSRPENWSFSVKGICSLCSDGYSSVSSAVAELEEAGFIKREGMQRANGRYSAGEWTVFDSAVNGNTVHENPRTEKTQTVKPCCEIQSSEIQLRENRKVINNEQINTEQTNNEQISLQSKKDMVTEEFKNRIDYDVLSDIYGSSLLDCICQAYADTVCSGRKTVKISGDDIPLCDVTERFRQLNSENLAFAIDTVSENGYEIKKPLNYWVSVLYNAPVDEKLWVESEFRKYKSEMGL